jgi:hypothetical protein
MPSNVVPLHCSGGAGPASALRPLPYGLYPAASAIRPLPCGLCGSTPYIHRSRRRAAVLPASVHMISVSIRAYSSGRSKRPEKPRPNELICPYGQKSSGRHPCGRFGGLGAAVHRHVTAPCTSTCWPVRLDLAPGDVHAVSFYCVAQRDFPCVRPWIVYLRLYERSIVRTL